MRILLAILLCLAAAPAMAACPLVLTGNWGDETAAEAQQAICLQQQLSAKLLAEQRQAQLKADYDLKLMLLEIEQRFKASTEFTLPPMPQF